MPEYSGYKRSLFVTVTKYSDGVKIYEQSYPTSTDIANGYFIYNNNKYYIPENTDLSYVSDEDYDELVTAFKLYVESIENVSFDDDEVNTNIEYDPIECDTGSTAPTTTTIEPTTTLEPCNINYTILPLEFDGNFVTISYALTSGSPSMMVELIGSSGVIATNLENTIPITNSFVNIPVNDDYQIVFTDLITPNCSSYENLSWCKTCEEGYTPIEDYCVLYDVIDPTYYETSHTILKKPENSSYGLYGTILFNNWNYDGTGDYLRIPTTNPYWTNLNYPSLNGPMNRSCVWGNVTRDNQDIGFSFCVNIAVPKTYYVGFGCDNYGKIKLNGELILEQDVDALATMFSSNGDPIGGGGGNYTDRIPFRYWFIYPVNLIAGQNFIEVIGHNDTLFAAVGIQIYDATVYDLVNATSDADLGSKKIFDSINLIGSPLHYEYSATGGYHGYVCPSDYALNTCEEPFTCVKANIEPCFTGEITYSGTWIPVCIIDEDTTITTTTLEPIEPTIPELMSSSDTDLTSADSSITIISPTGATVGEIMFLYVGCTNNTTISNPFGWNLIKKVENSGTLPSISLWWKIVETSDLSNPVTTINFGTPTTGWGSKVTVSGRSSAPYFSPITSANYSSADSSTYMSPSISTGIANSMVLIFQTTILPLVGETVVYNNSSWERIQGLNMGNYKFFSVYYTIQQSDGVTPIYEIMPTDNGDIQTIIVQVLS